jgi:hypothetical protein
MAVAAAIRAHRLLQVPINVRWLRSTDFNVLLVEVNQEVPGYSNTPSRGPRTIPFLIQVISES